MGAVVGCVTMWVIVLIGVICFLLLLAVIVVLIVVIVVKKRGSKGSVEAQDAQAMQVSQKPQVNEKAMAVVEQDNPGRGGVTDVKKLVDEMFALKDVDAQVEFASKYFERHFAYEEDLWKDTIKVPECRHTNLSSIYKPTQLVLKDPLIKDNRCLHATIIPDLFNNTIILSQAPIKSQMFNQLMGYWENNVNTVVVVGTFVEEGDVKIEPYWAEEEFKTLTLQENPNDPKSRRFEMVTNNAIKDEHGCDTYMITMKRSDLTEQRNITVVHLKDWPDFNMPKIPTNVCKGVMHIRELQQKRGGNLAAHCSAGMQRSVGVVAMLLSYQAFTHCEWSNPIGYLRYVWEHRWKGLSAQALKGNKPFMQMQLVVAALGTLMMWHTDALA